MVISVIPETEDVAEGMLYIEQHIVLLQILECIRRAKSPEVSEDIEIGYQRGAIA